MYVIEEKMYLIQFSLAFASESALQKTAALVGRVMGWRQAG